MMRKMKTGGYFWRRLLALVLAAVLILSWPVCRAEAASKVTVTLMNRSGTKVLKKIKVNVNGKLTLPANKNTTGTVFMGWSAKKNQKSNPTYLPAETIKVKKSMKLYEVRFNRSADSMPSEDSIPAVDTSKYAKVFFVGDSRFYHTSEMIGLNCSASFKKDRHIAFVAKYGVTLADFVSGSGGSWNYQYLLSALGKISRSKRKAVVFNLGVNDLYSYNNVTTTKVAYASFLRYFKKVLAGYNCDLIVLSVNPINPNTSCRREVDIRAFNSYIKNAGVYTRYIDSYHQMYKKGFNFSHYLLNKDDGVHYSQATSMRILKYVIERVNAGS